MMNFPKSRSHCLLLAAFVVLGQSSLHADWAQWRGPQRDGVIRGEQPLTALPRAAKPLWQVSAGSGHSGVIVAGGHLFYIDQRGDKEVAHLLDRATGKELWAVPFADPADYSNYGTGPRSTPMIEGDRIYVQSGRGEFRCMALADGKTLWRVNFETDFGATFLGNKSSDPAAKDTASRRHGNNGAPVVDGGRIFVAVGSPDKGTLVAFDKMTGKQLWAAGNENTAYSSLVVGTLAGVRQVVHLTADSLMGVACDSGKILWQLPVKTGAKRHVFTPLLVGDTVTIASHTVGMIRYKIAKAGGSFTAEPLWTNAQMKINISTSVLVEGKLYGIGASQGASASEFACVDFETGATLWKKTGFADYASTAAIGDRLLVLNATGELFLLAADPAGYKELGRMQPCGKTYSFPAYQDGTLYVRDDKTIRALPMIELP